MRPRNGNTIPTAKDGYPDFDQIGGAVAALGGRIEEVHGGVDWIIVGGESGPNARPMHPDWVRAIRDQCAAAGVPFFFQSGEWIDADQWLERLSGGGKHEAYGLRFDPARPLTFEEGAVLANYSGFPFERHSDGSTLIRVGKRRAGRMLDGRRHNDMPRRP